MKQIEVHDKFFETFISENSIQQRVAEIASQMNSELAGKKPLFLALLNGSFMFASDLFKKLQIECEISFVKLSSYSGTQSTGEIRELIGLNENIENRCLVILEDIVDTGITIDKLLNELRKKKPSEIKIATLLFKPEAHTKTTKLDYVGFEVPNFFLLGYGLDYDGLGRNLSDIYKIVD